MLGSRADRATAVGRTEVQAKWRREKEGDAVKDDSEGFSVE